MSQQEIKTDYKLSDFSEDSFDNLSSSSSSGDENEKSSTENIKLSELNAKTNNSSSIETFSDSRNSFISSHESVDNDSDLQYSIDSSILDSRGSLIKSKSKRKKNKKKNNIENDRRDEILLNTINAIAKDANIKFDNFEQAIEEEKFIDFLLLIFKDNFPVKRSIIQIKNSIIVNKSKVESLIELLSKLESKFKVLVFDFENDEFANSSVILLYSNILNFFFLKTSKKQLFERCYTILHYKDIENPKEKYREFDTLTQFETYVVLINFVLTGKANNKDTKLIYDNDDVPIIIDEQFLKENVTKNEIPNTIYFQLQLIFNYFDEKAIEFHLNELFLIAIRKIKLIKVPSTAKLAKSIRTKNISLILQMRRNKSYSNENQEENDIEYDINNNEMPELPTTFRERRAQHSIKIKQKIQKFKNSVSFLSAETFWNTPDINYHFKNGILYDESKKFDSQTLNKTQSPKRKALNKKVNQSLESEKLCKLYKFFYFNEQTNKWIYNESEFEQFKKDKKFDPQRCKLQFILFFGSKEKDAIDICSNLFTCKPPEINEDQICVYGICDEYELLNQLAIKMRIFLLLHVPKIKENLPSITRAVYQIYSFLFFIQDVIVVILNKNRKYQLHFHEKMDSIHNSLKFQDEIDSNKIKKSYLSINNINIKTNESNEEEEEEEEEANEIDDNDLYEGDKKIDLLYQLNSDFFDKQFKYIFVVNEIQNSEPKKNIIKEINEIFLSEKKINVKQKVNKNSIIFKCIFIDINELSTYTPLISFLNDSSLKQNYINEIEKNFQFLPLFEFSNSYITMKKDEKQINENLKNAVKKRFFMLKNNNTNVDINDFTIMISIQKEMLSTYPLLDSSYFEKCNLILTNLKKDISQANNGDIAIELENSSNSSLFYLDKIIKNEPYWTNEQINSIIDSHTNFLKEEFFNIVNDLFPQKIFIMIYAENAYILNNKIHADSETIRHFFKEFLDKMKKEKGPIHRKLQPGTNTTIQERENEREVEVKVENGKDINDLIEQDF